jgi:3-oxoacyl-[acyl-carrier-protein] synthase-3
LSFGIVALGESLGAPVEVTDGVLASYLDGADSRRSVRARGYRGFHRAADDEQLTDLAVRAAREALARASVAAADLDLVVVAIPDVAEYLCWDAAAAVQGRLGATRAEAVLINHACGGGVMAFDTVGGRLATHPRYEHALVVASNRVCEAYQNRMDSTSTVLSDGAAAAVVRRGGWPPR